MSYIPEEHAIGGISFRVYKKPSAAPSSRIAVLFLLHGRYGSWDAVNDNAKELLRRTEERKCSLWVITLNHRNHGSRTVNPRANVGWKENEGNERHAVDMYAIQTGTAQDVSLLIDFLPGYLFPYDDCKIDIWGVAGISLGGHSSWILLGEDPRIQVGIPIIGCPDYVALMKHRAEKKGLLFEAPHVPESLLEVVKRTNPAAKEYRALDGTNPFVGKKILVLSGASDEIVPWSASAVFVEGLEVGRTGVKEVVVEEGVGHQCTAAMLSRAAEFVQRQMLGV